MMKCTKSIFICLLVVLGTLEGCGGSKNTQPVANAGVDQTQDVIVGDVVILDGSSSSDAESKSIGYKWSLVSIPSDSYASLSDPTLAQPTFTVDVPGTYVARLVVNDGTLDSSPDEVNIVVLPAAPKVTIDSHNKWDVSVANSVIIKGTIDDPLATVTVNGNPTPNNNGIYSAETTLTRGKNTIIVVATNVSGKGSASVNIFSLSLASIQLVITSPLNGFTEGAEWSSVIHPTQVGVTVNGILIARNNKNPNVIVNSVPATLTVRRTGLFYTTYDFTAPIELSQGDNKTIVATGTDSDGRSITKSVTGAADICIVKEGNFSADSTTDAPALRGNNQNNRCHAVDGCSFPGLGKDKANNPTVALSNLTFDFIENDPMPVAKYNSANTSFGYGTNPPSEFFVHGQHSIHPYGCNNHDVCYQTCVPKDQRIEKWRACNKQQYIEHKAICRDAYPDTWCPYSDVVKCTKWRAEKTYCFLAANAYYIGVSTGIGKNPDPVNWTGWGAYVERQNQYCLSSTK